MRLFVAVRFPDEFLRGLTECQKSLKKAAALADGWETRANFSRAENLHLTLAFIGEREEAQSTVKALEAVRFNPLRISCGGLRKFGDTLVIVVRDGGECMNLAESVRRALDGAGIPYDDKPFVPHITLARKFVSGLPDGASLFLPDAGAAVKTFSLMKSERINGVLTYTELWRSDPRKSLKQSDF